MKPIVYVLGGGQLGEMLQVGADKLGIDIKFLCQESDPCSRFDHKVGDVTNYDDVVEFGKELVDIENSFLTIEIENVNAKALEYLQNQLHVECNNFHEPLGIIQNKYKQKLTLNRYGIPTSNFIAFDSLESVVAVECLKTNKIVWKSIHGGRDGFGVQKVSKIREIKNKSIPCILEEEVDICEEISVIVARDVQGNMIAYPPVRMEFGKESHQVELVQYPLVKVRNHELGDKIHTLPLLVAEAFGCVGLLAVEMFIDINGQLLVNEVAPRLHNSGHLWTEACDTSQAMNHLLAITGQNIVDPQLNTIMCSMINITGSGDGDHYNQFVEIAEVELDLLNNGNFDIAVYDYKKKGVRKNRKMGHIVIRYTGGQNVLTGSECAVYEKLVKHARRIKVNPV